MHYQETTYGFEYGAAHIERLFSDEKKEWVVLGLRTKKYPHSIQLYVTKTGKVRIFHDGHEWKLVKKRRVS